MRRLADILISLVLILFSAPLLLGIALISLWKMGTPVLFRQQRTGLHEKPFTLIKFRTMPEDPEESGIKVNTQNVTPWGQFLRSSSLDELPSLWNVLKGDMSLVGPRPLPAQYLERYNSRQRKRHEIKPGLTGWAQVQGRNKLTWQEKFECDLWYLRNQSPWLDAKILIKTVGVVLRRQGINANGQQTMPEFEGS